MKGIKREERRKGKGIEAKCLASRELYGEVDDYITHINDSACFNSYLSLKCLNSLLTVFYLILTLIN